MALKSSKPRQANPKAKAETRVKRALAQLDTAVQAWYAEHNPKNTEHYASASFMDNPEVNYHVARITLNDAKGNFIDIKSTRNGYGKNN